MEEKKTEETSMDAVKELNTDQKVPSEVWRSLSHKQRRSYVNKMRRKYRRKRAAQQKQAVLEALEADPGYLEMVCEEERREAEKLRLAEARSLLENAAWLQRERVAQEEFRKKRELEEKRRIEKEERERLIREEWEALQEKERQENRAKEREKEAKEERLKEALSLGEKPPVPENQPWHNPLAPEDYNTPQTDANAGTEKDKNFCSFFLKTGACRFGDACSRKHPRVSSSCTLLIPGMFSSLIFHEQMLNERDHDVALEYDDKEIYEDFRNFYNDVLPEFSKAGKVVQFKVCRNYEAHLRGNVYVQFQTEEECAKAFQMFNGRWYAQKQLSCHYCSIKKWKSAICGMYNQKRCPKGRNCNFLHVFPNPMGAFSRADRDLPPRSSPIPSTPSSRQHSPNRHRKSSVNRHPSWNGRRESWSRRSSRSRSPPPDTNRRRRRSHTRSKSRERFSRRSRSKSRERPHSRRSKSRERTHSRRSKHRRRSRSQSCERRARRRKSLSDRSKHHHRRASSFSSSDAGSSGVSSRSHSRSTSSEERGRRRKHKKKKKSKKHRHHRSHTHKRRAESEADNASEGNDIVETHKMVVDADSALADQDTTRTDLSQSHDLIVAENPSQDSKCQDLRVGLLENNIQSHLRE